MRAFGFHRSPSFRCFFRNLAAGLLLLAVQMLPCAFAQTELATVLGRVTDPSGAVVPGAEVEIRNVETNLRVMSETNGDGLYSIPSLHPGHYVMSVRKAGFKSVSLTQLDLNVQDNVVRNFALQVGSSAESITVTAEGGKINTTDATVSTVVDRNFAENLPMNGRSFQTLIQLTPGVVVTPSTLDDSGQFSVNGQRADSNYWTVDGVSANFGINTYVAPGNGFGGALGAFSAQGGTNSLVSIDALQEFRIQTSTYAPEFGRTPGAQISIVTRSGTNQFHGTAFDYLRNDFLDATDWFNGYTNDPPLPKAEERQNDFGGTFSGPILKDRTFFFFSYEGLRLRVPHSALTTVPDVIARQNASTLLQPYLNAYPLPNGAEILDSQGNPTGAAHFNASVSNRSSLDAYSLRVDHKLNNAIGIFGRYDHSPSEIVLRQRGVPGAPVNNLLKSRIIIDTGTLGATWSLSPSTINEFRFNYSKAQGVSRVSLDDFGGAIPLPSLPFPAPFTAADSRFTFTVFSLSGDQYDIGNAGSNTQRQVNFVDSLTLQRGSHSLKLGVDYRRLSPRTRPFSYSQNVFFGDVSSAASGQLLAFENSSGRSVTALLNNLGVFAQDTWRIMPRLTFTYGLRWDVDFAPSVSEGPRFPAVTGYNLNDLSRLTLLPAGPPPFNTPYDNIAPRIGLAYQLRQSADWSTVLRGGFGVFYDLVDGELAQGINLAAYPFDAVDVVFGGNFPLDAASAAPPQITMPGGGTGGFVAFDPHLRLPYTLEWNVAAEQSLGKEQSLSASYIGAAARNLIQSAYVSSPNPNYGFADLIGNSATSDYEALQMQFQRRLAQGLQALASYSWSHSIDTASAGSAFGNGANALVPGENPNLNRGPSDFDIRNAFSAGVTYALSVGRTNKFAGAVLHGWSLQNVVQAFSAPPVNAIDSQFSQLLNAQAAIRPDVVPGIPLYLYGPQYPGGKAFNNTPNLGGVGCLGPFCPPPTDSNGSPLRQGTLGRNALRGFGAVQWDFALHREFRIRELLKLQFRAEMFNVLNHPNFAAPTGDISNTNQFGLSTQMLGQSLGANVGNGGFDALYQIGGPRSVQLALKVEF
jgi:hypothetical protein